MQVCPNRDPNRNPLDKGLHPSSKVNYTDCTYLKTCGGVCSLIKRALSSSDYIASNNMTVSNELERIWKEAVRSNLNSNPAPPEYKVRSVTA
jgi:hypothetical protein